jgi:hypothetical protein
MSFWSPLPFDNDDAADWLSDLLEQDEVKPIADAFCAVTRPSSYGEDSYVEIPEACAAVAAAQVLCVVTNLSDDVNVDRQDARELHASIRDWATQFAGRRLSEKWFSSAIQALSAAHSSSSSELYEVWMQSNQFDEWQKSIHDLVSYFEQRLSATTP